LFPYPYGIDVETLRGQAVAARQQRGAIRSRLGIGPDDFVVLGIVKFVERENPWVLLKAFASLRTRSSKAHLVLVGDGALKEPMLEYIAGSGVPGVHFPGYVPYRSLAEYYGIADVFVHPARFEPWGVSVQEALVCGVPVVASKTVGSAWDLVIGQDTGEVFDPEDPEELARILTELAESPHRLASMAERAFSVGSAINYEDTTRDLKVAVRSLCKAGA
jgi:glycosyltransferase involved in cell wall biosynthesis